MLSKEEIENLATINEEKLDKEVSQRTKELENKIRKQLEERGCDDIYHNLITDLLIRNQDEAYKIGLKEGSHFEEIRGGFEDGNI
jgi:phosphopantothenate synthetase